MKYAAAFFDSQDMSHSGGGGVRGEECSISPPGRNIILRNFFGTSAFRPRRGNGRTDGRGFVTLSVNLRFD